MTQKSVLCLFILGTLLVVATLLVRTMWGHYRAVLHDFDPAPATPILAHPERTGIAGLSPVAFRASSGARIAGWYAPSHNRAGVVVTHGTNADRSSMLDEIRLLADAGFGVLAFDWPGNGESAGEVRWGAAEREALTAAIDWLSLQPDVDAHRIGAFGFSMGGYFVTQVAADDARLRAVVIAATPPSFLAYTRRQHRSHGWLSRFPAELALRRVGMLDERRPPLDCIRDIAPRPVLLLAGSEDRSIPADMAREMHERAGPPKELWIVEGAAHGHYLAAAPQEYPRRIIGFFSAHLER